MNVKQEANVDENPLFDEEVQNEPTLQDKNVFSREGFYERDYSRPPPQFIIIQKEPGLIDFIPLIFSLIIYGLIIQTLCMLVKKANKRIYDRLVFAVLFFAPPLIFMQIGFYLFPVIWATFASFMGSLYIRINRKPLQKDIPRKIFNIFKSLFIFTNLGICIFQTLTLLSFYFFQESLVKYFTFLLSFVYFALLSRELVYFFSETMATNTGFYSKEGVPTRNNNDSLCMICTKVFDNTELVHTLICHHSFHENCIKGWCMIAKKKSCPYCKKGVDLETIPKDFWYKSEVWFFPLINALRGFIVFTVFISIVIFYKVALNKV